MPSAVMIFAAGFGTRMMPLTKDKPKPMIHVSGRPLIDHALDIARTAGCDPIVANLHYKPQVLETHLANTKVRTILEEPDILDTGGGLRNALPLLGSDPVHTLNPDAIWQGPNPLSFAKETWDPGRMDALLVCVEPQNALGSDSDGDFAISETGALSRGKGVIYAGAQIIKTDRLSEIREASFSLNRLWDLMIKDGRCFGAVYPGRWCDVGHPEGIPIAEELLRDV